MPRERTADAAGLLTFKPRFYRGGPISLHLPLLYDLVRERRPRQIVVLGFSDGDAVFTLAQAAREHQTESRLLVVRRAEDGEEKSDAPWQEGAVYAAEFYPAETTFRSGDAVALVEAAEIAPIDLFLIDDCDSGAVVRRELAACERMLSANAVVLLHGTKLERQDAPGTAWSDFVGAQKSIESSEGIGMGVTIRNSSPEAKGLRAIAERLPLYQLVGRALEAEQRADTLVRENSALQARQTFLDSAREHWWRAQLVMEHQERTIRDLQGRFDELLADRVKAQQVMETQAARLKEVEHEKAKLKAALSKERQPRRRRPMPARIARELARTWQKLRTGSRKGSGPE